MSRSSESLEAGGGGRRGRGEKEGERGAGRGSLDVSGEGGQCFVKRLCCNGRPEISLSCFDV